MSRDSPPNSSTLIEQYPLIFSRESEQRCKHAAAESCSEIDGVFTEQRLRAHSRRRGVLRQGVCRREVADGLAGTFSRRPLAGAAFVIETVLCCAGSIATGLGF